MEEKILLKIQMEDTQITVSYRSDEMYRVMITCRDRVVCTGSYMDECAALKRVCTHINFIGPFKCLLNCTNRWV